MYFILLVIAIPTFFFCKWLTKKFIQSNKNRQTATWIATIVLTPVIYVGLIFLFIIGLSYTPSKDFDKSEWLSDAKQQFQMADDIIDSKLLIAKDSSQVKEILGEPIREKNSWTYYMGEGGGGLGFLFHYLIIRFGKGRVIAVEHNTIRD